ncbi:putative uncharacterized serine-rich protein [Phaeomoniella chlamydospora]|uniref:Uncharacterized serine-rich protein n=1 Tax=Phaeomoniella chlamydospora TaxID=158046 RepID=A0A0G2ENR4_PHACM|nr:putative uncharacterized serine-rich protein [Phaeomoniella chlamydospora]
MLWSDATDLTSVWSSNVASLGGSSATPYILGFNEPDLSTQANMTVSEAVSAWLTYIEPLSSQGYKLGAPAVTNGGSPMGLTWLSSFLEQCSTCTIDFIPIHWYDSATNFYYFKAYMQEAHQVAGDDRPLWITEFQAYGSEDEQITFLETVMPWLDSLTWIQRYAWFGVFQDNLVSADGSVMTPLGQVYRDYYNTTVSSIFS